MHMRYDEYKLGVEFLRANAPIFAHMYEHLGYLEQRRRTANFEAFVSTIVGQQLSGKAADTIYSRLCCILSNDVNPASISAIDIDELRSAGISNAKARYILLLAEKFLSKEITIEDLEQSDDEALYKKLIGITGIGPWSARIIMLFNFCRLSAFPFGDTTLERAYSKLTHKDLTSLESDVATWQPYSGIVAMYLWSFNDKIGLDGSVA